MKRWPPASIATACTISAKRRMRNRRPIPLRLPETCARCHAERRAHGEIQDQHQRSSPTTRPACTGRRCRRGTICRLRIAPPVTATTEPLRRRSASVADVCGTCHVVFRGALFNKSPHQPAFADLGACTGLPLESRHQTSLGCDAGRIVRRFAPSATTTTSAGGKAALEMASLIKNLDESVQRSDKLLERGRSYGMEVSEAVLRQAEAKENLEKARVAVHAFHPDAVRKPVPCGPLHNSRNLERGRDGSSRKRLSQNRPGGIARVHTHHTGRIMVENPADRGQTERLNRLERRDHVISASIVCGRQFHNGGRYDSTGLR